MAFSRRVQSINRIRSAGNCRIEPKRPKRAFEIIVDGLGNAHDRYPMFIKLLGNAERPIAANRNERTQSQFAHPALHIIEQLSRQTPAFAMPDFGSELPAVRRAENRPAAKQETIQRMIIKRTKLSRWQ